MLRAQPAPQAGVNFDLTVGHVGETQAVSWNRRDIVLYALGIGSKETELDYVYEQSLNFRPFPTYPLVLGFKGEGSDDLRQDAVMEQVFQLVNLVLHRDRDTRKRHLHIRCYKVIPLAPQAGMLEFVPNTSPTLGCRLPTSASATSRLPI